MKFAACLIISLLILKAAIAQVPVENGVSLKLATYRHKIISNIQYKLAFNIPAEKSVALTGTEVLTFNLTENSQPLQLDFKQSAENLTALTVNGKPSMINLTNEHLVIAKNALVKGANRVALSFTSGDASLNRNNEYLYCLFVPDHARSVFPCFDQPDLKARFLLTLTVPKYWQVLANGRQTDHRENSTSVTYHFANSDKLPTYLFSFTAGKYTYAKQNIGNRDAEFLYRETDPAKIRLSVDSVFIDHKNAINFLQNWTGRPFPFQKVGFVAIPDFQFGGMEHPGEVQYKASSLFLDEGATRDQFLSRATLISHETAHMWFGDMVTMQWFNDVWMKEVFANFMADKVSEKVLGTDEFNLRFLQDHYPAAYAVDRTAGANPIRQQLDNLQDAGSLYGNIIYHKAPIMMRQLELLMGKEHFRAGIREYLKKYAYGNATWDNLIGILSKYTRADLYKWNRVWVNQPGRPVFDSRITYSGNQITGFDITQTAEQKPERIWPQNFSVTLVYANTKRPIKLKMDKQLVSVSQAIGLEKPLYIIYNSDGYGYGLFPNDAGANAGLYNRTNTTERSSLYIGDYENMLAGRYFKPAELLELYKNGLTAETNESSLRLLTNYFGNIYWEFLTAQQRAAVSAGLEQALWNAMTIQTAANNKKILFKAYQDIYTSGDALKQIHNIWETQKAPEGVKLTEDDYTSLALSLALKGYNAHDILPVQIGRVKNDERKKRLEFMLPALSQDVRERDAFFASLADRKNRQKEAWVTAALSYLNHPLRQSISVKYLQKSLDMVEEIQQTGDLFFPQSWLASIFSSYQSEEAASIVKDFLASHPNYNPKLKAKIQQATDNLMRAQTLVR
ncbi:M1 family aminopeptidase [Mucilaginibacter ginkgonis]|uniref:M1 family aminopeptidase n=1 Tax=Mucilaginibacter ginkgonis TaxID=2682091 RepID=UPI001FC8B293|nr:M1 family aminopeptidase [Mucilaginibacter ginkgonis]